MMVPKSSVHVRYVDVAAAMNERSLGKTISLDILSDAMHNPGEATS
jgi:hypothetical protein